MPSDQLFENMPLYARLADDRGVLEHICGSVQPELDQIRRIIGARGTTFAPDSAPSVWLDWLGQFVGLAPVEDKWLGLGLNPEWPPSKKREVIQRIWRYWHSKGTEWGIREAIALWLDWEDAHASDRLDICQPIGKSGPNSWYSGYHTYATPFGYNTLRSAKEHRRLGVGETPGAYRPTWHVFPAQSWHWSYASGYLPSLTKERAAIQKGRSYMGPYTSHLHFELFSEDEWHKIFPGIYELAPEIFLSKVNPVYFAWYNIPKVQHLVRLEAGGGGDIKVRTKQSYRLHGWNYYHGFLPAARPDRTESVVVEDLVQFNGVWPGFTYTSLFGQSPPFYAPSGEVKVPRQEEQTIEGVSCIPGPEVEIQVGNEVVNRTILGEPPNQYVEVIERPALEARTVVYRGQWPGFTYTTPLPYVDQPGLESIEQFIASIQLPGSIDTSRLTVRVPEPKSNLIKSQEMPLGRLKTVENFVAPPKVRVDLTQNETVDIQWQTPVRIFNHYSRLNDGSPWLFLGSPGQVEEVTVPVRKRVRLCNVREIFTTREVLWRQSLPMPLDIKSDSRLHQIRKPESWYLLLYCDRLIRLTPYTFYWENAAGDRNTTYSEDYRNLFLEFAFEPDIDQRISAIGLYVNWDVGAELLHHKRFSKSLDASKGGSYGFKFRVPVIKDTELFANIGSFKTAGTAINVQATGFARVEASPAESSFSGPGALIEYPYPLTEAIPGAFESVGYSASAILIDSLDVSVGTFESVGYPAAVSSGFASLIAMPGFFLSSALPAELRPDGNASLEVTPGLFETSGGTVHASTLEYVLGELTVETLFIDTLEVDLEFLSSIATANSPIVPAPELSVVSGTKSLLGSSGMVDRTADRYQNSSYSLNDEGVVEINLSFPVTIGENSYRLIYPNSNSYITFGEAHAQFAGFDLNGSPNKPTLFLAAEDGGWLSFYEEKTVEYTRLRFEGSDSTSPTNPNVIWECTFFNPALTNGSILIEVVFSTLSSAKRTALFGIGGGGSSLVPADGGAPEGGESYVFESDSTGVNWTIHPASYVG